MAQAVRMSVGVDVVVLARSDAAADEIKEKGDKSRSERYGGRGGFVVHVPYALVLKHDETVEQKVDERGGEDDSCSEMTSDKEHISPQTGTAPKVGRRVAMDSALAVAVARLPAAAEPRADDREENAQAGRDEDDEYRGDVE